MWRCFYGNLSAGLKASSNKAKMRFLQSSVSSIPSFRWSRWPHQDTCKTTLDATQRHMIGILTGCRPSPEEPFEKFRKRRHKLTNRLAAKHGKWSKSWACKVKSWGDHVYRNHDPATWSASLLRFHGEDWLQQQRVRSSGIAESRTNTRAYRGHVHRRWQQGYERVLAHPEWCGPDLPIPFNSPSQYNVFASERLPV